MMKHGIRVATAYFEYQGERRNSFASDRLLNASNYVLNVSELEHDRKQQGTFRSLFRQPERKQEGSESIKDV